MTDAAPALDPAKGDRLIGGDGRRIGRVDALYADYLLVRTRGLLPVDLFVPRAALIRSQAGELRVVENRRAAYAAWHRPLKRAPHP